MTLFTFLSLILGTQVKFYDIFPKVQKQCLSGNYIISVEAIKFYDWFVNNYSKTKTRHPNDCISIIQNVLPHFRASETFQSLSKTQQKSITLSFMISVFTTPTFINSYKAKINTFVEGRKFRKKHVLIDWVENKWF